MNGHTRLAALLALTALALPNFSRLFSSTQFRETRTLPLGSKGDVPIVGVYETGKTPTPAVWRGSAWTYINESFEDVNLLGE